MAWWQPCEPFTSPVGCVCGDFWGVSVCLSSRCHVVKAGSRHLSHSDPKSVKDQVTDYDTGEQLAGSRAELSGSSAAHLRGCGSQKYPHCVISLPLAALPGLGRDEKLSSLLLSCSGL